LEQRLQRLEKRMENVEQLGIENTMDLKEATAFARLTFLGPSADPIVEAAATAKKEYDEMEAESRGAPSVYKALTVIAILAEDLELDSDVREPLSDFLAAMKSDDDPTYWASYIEVWRFAGTHERVTTKLHIQLSRKCYRDYADVEEALTRGLKGRGWDFMPGPGPKSKAFKNIMKEVVFRRGW
jgi:hypothetical protein